MKAIHWIIAAAALAFVQAIPASAAQGDPEVIIYRFPGVVDNGGSMLAGVATVFSCTNFSGVTENVRFVVRNFNGNLASNLVFAVDHLTTRNAATHLVFAYANQSLNTAQVQGGTTAIAATSINVICTAVITDAGSSLPQGASLRGIRFNPVPGSQE